MTDAPKSGANQAVELEARAHRYADALMRQWDIRLRGFLEQASGADDRSIRHQVALHVLTTMHQQQLARCAMIGTPYHGILSTIAGGLQHASKTLEIEATRQKISRGT